MSENIVKDACGMAIDLSLVNSNTSVLVPRSDAERSQICEYLANASDEDGGGWAEANGIAEYWSMDGPDQWRVLVTMPNNP